MKNFIMGYFKTNSTPIVAIESKAGRINTKSVFPLMFSECDKVD
jgi:hypothetical protein